MNMIRNLGLTAVVFGVMLAGNTKATDAEVHTLKLTHAMIVAGVDLHAAAYDIRWDIEGTRATVTFSQKGHVVATIQGKCAVFDRSVPADTLYISKHPDGFPTIYALGFASTNKGIVFPLIQSRSQPLADAHAFAYFAQ